MGTRTILRLKHSDVRVWLADDGSVDKIFARARRHGARWRTIAVGSDPKPHTNDSSV